MWRAQVLSSLCGDALASINETMRGEKMGPKPLGLTWQIRTATRQNHLHQVRCLHADVRVQGFQDVGTSAMCSPGDPDTDTVCTKCARFTTWRAARVAFQAWSLGCQLRKELTC